MVTELKKLQRWCAAAFVALTVFNPAFAKERNNGELLLKSVLTGTDIFSIPVVQAFGQGDVLLDAAAALEIPEVDPDIVAYQQDIPDGEPVAFKEVWAYVMDGRYDAFDDSMPVTDLCFFSADVNCYGEISSIPDPSKIENFTGRKHLVITCDSRSLTHFIIDPKYGVRQKLVKTIAKASKRFDGIQVDFELVPARDADNFRSFLGDIRNAIGTKKWMSVCVPARMKATADDVYLYSKIVPVVDRVFVMAYDEHWGGSVPGSIASLEWCRKVAEYASSVIPEKKLIMGLPFYGRTWTDSSYAKAWLFSSMNRVMNENNCHEVVREEEIPKFEFDAQVHVTGYFEDTWSLYKRCQLYKDCNVAKIGFWRIGQEDPGFWKWLKVE